MIVQDKNMIADTNDLTDIENKLEAILEKLISKSIFSDSFGDYFSQNVFNNRLDQLLKETY